MKKLYFPFLALAALFGIAGAFLRANLLENAKELAPLWILLAAALVISTVFAIFFKKSKAEIAESRRNTCLFPFAISALLILAYAGMLAFSLREKLEPVEVILALLSLYCAVSLLVIGKYNLAERDSTAYCTFAAVPVFWACFMLIIAFREKIADPVISNYVLLIFAYIALLFFAYGIAAHLLGKNKKHVSIIACFMGISLILTDIGSSVIIGDAATRLREIIPELAFLVMMPFATFEIIRKNKIA